MDRAQLSDKLKLRFLEQIRAEKNSNSDRFLVKEYERCESDIIVSLYSMELREKLLGDIQDGTCRARIIAGFDEATIEKYIGSIENDYELVIILRSDNVSDEFREKYAPRISNDEYMKFRIWEKSDDQTIERHLQEANNDDKPYMIRFLKSDELKVKYLEQIEDESDRYFIIASLKSDELKLKYLGDIEKEDRRASIIASLGDNSLKESYLTDVKEESSRAEIIASFKSDELKLKYLPSIESVSDRAKIIISLENDEDKVRFAKELDIYYQTGIMATVKDEKKRLEFLYGEVRLNNFFARELDNYSFKLLNSFKNYREKNRFSSLIPLEYASKLMASITGEEKDFPAETIALLGEETGERIQDESDLGGLSIEELRAMQQSNEAEIKSNEQEIERQQLLNIIKGQRARIKEQRETLNELTSDKKKEEVGGGDGK